MKNATKTKISFCVMAALVAIVVVVASCLSTLVFTRYSEGVLPTTEDLANAVVYERVLLIGVDGAGNYFDQVDTPNIDRIFGGGNINYRAWSQYPTTSAHNWTAMLHGVRYQKHGINNSVAAKKKYSKDQWPSIFKVCGQAYPEAKMISLTPWYPINYGIIEDMDNLIKYDGPKTHKDDPMLDVADIQMKKDLIAEIAGGLDPKIAFAYFAEVDEYGHAGGKNEAYYQSIERVDGYIGEIYDQYVASGLAQDTLFVLVTDHGHRQLGGHGMNSKTERTVTIAVAGSKGNIVPGVSNTGKAVTQDVASIILYGLGIEQPDTWESRVPYGLFTTLPTE